MEETNNAFQIAKLYLRIFAALIDGFILIIIYFITAIITGILLHLVGISVNSLGTYFPHVFVLLVTAVYYTWLIGRHGQTLGKLILGIRVVLLDDSKPGYGHAFLRWVGYVINGITFGLGYLVALFNSRRRGLHDFMVGTKVVSVSRPSLWGKIFGILLLILVLLWFLFGFILMSRNI